MKMTYYKLKDLLATYGVGFYFGKNKVEFYKDKNAGEVRKAHNGFTVIFNDKEGNIIEQYRLFDSFIKASKN